MKYRDKLDQMEARYAELTAQMADPAIISDGEQYRKVAKAHSDMTEIVTKISGDPTQAGRTWVILTEAAEGGWGMLGTAFGKEEFATLAAKARVAKKDG